MPKKQIIILSVLIAILVLGGTAYGIYYWLDEPAQTGCTMEAKLCPDGSAVGRSGPNCEFAACPVENGQVCIQVITPAKNKQTGECKEFATPCAVPEGWDKLDSCAAEGVF
ncbi:MAG: hypothetical protein Q8O93_05045 [bacterium]|nr:hypothetical protein [bacterium]